MTKTKLIILLMFFSLYASAFSQEKTVKIATGEWTPYISESLNGSGPLMQIIREAFNLEGIGGTISYDYGRAFMESERSGCLSVEWVKTDLINLRKLAYGRIEVFPCNLVNGSVLILNELTADERKKITYYYKPLRTTAYYLTFSRSNPENEFLRDRFDSGLEKLKQSGRYQSIISDAGWVIPGD